MNKLCTANTLINGQIQQNPREEFSLSSIMNKPENRLHQYFTIKFKKITTRSEMSVDKDLCSLISSKVIFLMSLLREP
jgi:hypothetical protein